MTRRAGLSIVETIVALAILGVVLGITLRNLRVGKLSGATVEKLESIQELRVAQRHLLRLLETATGVLYPAPGKSGPCVVVTDEVNHLHLVHLDPEGRLRLQALGAESRVLAEGIDEFRATQAFAEELEMVLRAAPRGEGRPLQLVVTAHAGNHFYAERSAP